MHNIAIQRALSETFIIGIPPAMNDAKDKVA